MKHLPLSLLLYCLVHAISAQPCPQAAQIRRDMQSAYDAGLFESGNKREIDWLFE